MNTRARPNGRRSNAISLVAALLGLAGFSSTSAVAKTTKVSPCWTSAYAQDGSEADFALCNGMLTPTGLVRFLSRRDEKLFRRIGVDGPALYVLNNTDLRETGLMRFTKGACLYRRSRARGAWELRCGTEQQMRQHLSGYWIPNNETLAVTECSDPTTGETFEVNMNAKDLIYPDEVCPAFFRNRQNR